MNDELKLGYILEVEDSNPPFTNSETTSTSKRKAEDDNPLLHKKKIRLLKGIKATELHAILQKDPITFCQEVGLLPKSVKCYCNEDMKLEVTGRIKKHYAWVCRKYGHIKKHTLKKGTWFENSHMSILDILWIMYMWVYRYSTGLMMHECDNGPNAIIGWNKRCLEVCQLILEIKSDPLGGEQKVVEIFECKFNNGNSDLIEEDSEKWVFCALEQNSTKSLLIVVENKTSDCILQLFSKYILPGTTIVSLFWSPYKNLTKKDFVYLTKQRSVTFYHSTTKVKMDTFKEFVTGVNRHQPLTHLVKNEYEASFFEKMYRKSLCNASDAYIVFLKDVALVYKPLDVAVKLEPKTETVDD